MNSLRMILISGIVLRVFLSFATFHPDTVAFYLGGREVASGHILNLYDFSSNLAVFNYPPLIYWFHGLFHLVSFSNYGFVKLPYLIFDLLIVWVFLKIFPQGSSKLAIGLWMFNPVALFATYMMGQFDIIPTFFTLLSVYLISKNKLDYAALALGSGVAFKLYPIFLLIPLMILGKSYMEKFKLAVLALFPYLVSIIPYLPSHNFRSMALFASQSSKSLYANIPISGGEAILLFPVSLLIFYLLIRRKVLNKLFFWRIYTVALLLFFIFTHYHPQWLIWITPFLIMDLTKERFKNLWPVSLILVSWVGSLFFFDPSLTVGMFAPLVPALAKLPAVWQLLNLNLDYNFSRSLLQTIFVGASIYLIYEYSTA